MRTVKIEADNGAYDIRIGKGILENIGAWTAEMGYQKAAVVTDRQVAPLYLDAVEKALKEAGVEAFPIVFPEGEASKCQSQLFSIYQRLLEGGLKRDHVLLALGGGVVGDMAGFAAATYLRGVDFIQIPTTLLAQVDSSVGGKVAIDLPSAKNAVGAFYQPKLVVADTDTLETLSTRQLASGMAEVIKYAAIYDASLEETIYQGDYERLVERCCQIKAEYVRLDPYDKGRRMELNFGHTIGHGLEAASHFTLLHGEGVAIGMAAMAQIGEKWGITRTGVYARIAGMLEKWNLPKVAKGLDASLVRQAMEQDKKFLGGQVNAVWIEEMGRACCQPTTVDALMTAYGELES